MAKHVFGFYGPNANNALKVSSDYFKQGFAARGYDVDIIDAASAADKARVLAALQAGRVAFGFGLQGVGSLLSFEDEIVAWQAFGVPFVGLHHDHPCYNTLHHLSASRFVGNLYFYRCFLEDKLRFLPSAQLSRAASFGFLQADLPPAPPFETRPFRFLYPKTGQRPASFLSFLAEVPANVRMALTDQIVRLLQDPNLSICQMVGELFDALRLDRQEQFILFWHFVKMIDSYIRAQHAMLFVQWLMKQEGAVIVGNGWDFLDKTGARASFLPSMDFGAMDALYQQARFVCNTNPHGHDFVHERVLIGLAYGACVLSDSNSWWDTHGGALPALSLFNWRAPLDAQLEAIMDLPDAAARAAQGPEAANKLFQTKPFDAVLAFVDDLRSFAAENAAS